MSEGKLTADELAAILDYLEYDSGNANQARALRGHIASLESERDTLRAALEAVFAEGEHYAKHGKTVRDCSQALERTYDIAHEALARLHGDGGQGTVVDSKGESK